MDKIEEEVIKLLQKNRNIKPVRTRKERQHHLIVKGAIFEILGLDEEDDDFLIGLLLKAYDISEEEKKAITNYGNKFKVKRYELKDKNKL